jgi:hypothetical protein
VEKCIFCGRANGKLSTEHVFPRWARKAFNLGGPVSVQVGGVSEPGRLLEQRQHLTLFLRDAICELCNQRFGRELEGPVSTILRPMAIDALRTELDTPRQALLATWATKTAFLLELAVRQHYPGKRAVDGYIPSEPELAWLGSRLESPPRARVWLGAFDARNVVNLRHEACLIHVRDWLPAHVTTFTLGYVAFQVFTINYLEADVIELQHFNVMPKELEALLALIWPRQQMPALSWPQTAFGDGHWAAVTQWPSRIPRRDAA